MVTLKSFAVDVAHQAGKLLKKKFNQTHKIQYKGEIDLLRGSGQNVENVIIKAIRRKYPAHGY
jgi:fructose-1,6-bisphosphatase/inositol monophosphatase family enzyme